MYNEYSYMAEGEFDAFMLMLTGIILIAVLVVLVIAAVVYVFQAVGMYTLAKRRGIKNAWLAWLPVGNYWILGSISDQYQYVVKEKVRNLRKVLLGLSIGSVVLSGIMQALSGDVVEQVMYMALEGSAYGIGAVLADSLGVVLVWMLSSVISVVSSVFWYIGLYNLYTSCDPGNNVLYLVLSVIFGVTQPFFVFACRNKDRGMPPRRPQPAPIPEPRREPWENTTEE